MAGRIECVDCGDRFDDVVVAEAHWLARHNRQAEIDWGRAYGWE